MPIFAAAFFLNQNLTRRKDSVIKPLEALAIGIPAICTDCPVGGARMYIRDGENGYLIPVGDADVMADRMLALMEDKKLGESFSKESVKIREELTDDRIFGMWKALLVR